MELGLMPMVSDISFLEMDGLFLMRCSKSFLNRTPVEASSMQACSQKHQALAAPFEITDMQP